MLIKRNTEDNEEEALANTSQIGHRQILPYVLQQLNNQFGFYQLPELPIA